MVGGTTIETYTAGPSKLLGQRNDSAAASNNDNYVYFAISRFMQKKFGTYPPYPRAWRADKTPKENFDKEKREPGYASIDTSNLSEDITDESPIVSEDPAPASAYPEWYQPVIEHSEDATEPPLTVPPEEQIPLADPDANFVSCNATIKPQPNFDDCVHAFGALNNFPNNPAHHDKDGEVWYAGVSSRCNPPYLILELTVL